MKPKNNSPVLFNAKEVYNFFFYEHECRISLDFPMILLYYLDNIAQKDDKIILINTNQENNLFDEEFVCNGTRSIELDNLSHIYVQKYKKEWDEHTINEITDLDHWVDENCKYSNFLADLIVQINSIEQISNQKISEIINLFLGITIPRQRIYDLFNKKIDEYTNISIKELQEKILDGNIEFSGIIHYDEEYLWIKHQPYVRLTLLDAKNKLIIEDTVIPRYNFTKNYIKQFLEASLENLEVKTIITDGYHAYSGIIEELGFNHQRCTFHSMKNLMDDLLKKHNSLNRKIKTLNNQIPNLEKQIKEIEEKYKGQTGRIRKNDTQRKNDNAQKKELKKELSEKKALRKKYKKILEEDDKLVKQISLIFKSKTYKTAKKTILQIIQQTRRITRRNTKILKKTIKIPRKNNTTHNKQKHTPYKQLNRMLLQNNTPRKS